MKNPKYLYLIIELLIYLIIIVSILLLINKL